MKILIIVTNFNFGDKLIGGDEGSMFRNINAFTNFSDNYNAILKVTQKITKIRKKK